MNYQLTQIDGFVQVIGTDAYIPADPANSDYAAYLTWLAEGNTPEPYVAPPPAPVTCITSRQARLALNAAGLLPTVNAAVAASSEQVKIEWEYAQELERDWPTLLALSVELGLTTEQVDELFLQASLL